MIEQSLIEKNRKRLEAERDHLRKLLSRVSDGDAVSSRAKYPDIGSKDDENASEVAEYETNIAEEHDLAKRLERVEAALERIAKRIYGFCQVGGEELSASRLAAVPEAENCVEHEPR